MIISKRPSIPMIIRKRPVYPGDHLQEAESFHFSIGNVKVLKMDHFLVLLMSNFGGFVVMKIGFSF